MMVGYLNYVLDSNPYCLECTLIVEGYCIDDIPLEARQGKFFMGFIQRTLASLGINIPFLGITAKPTTTTTMAPAPTTTTTAAPAATRR